MAFLSLRRCSFESWQVCWPLHHLLTPPYVGRWPGCWSCSPTVARRRRLGLQQNVMRSAFSLFGHGRRSRMSLHLFPLILLGSARLRAEAATAVVRRRERAPGRHSGKSPSISGLPALLGGALLVFAATLRMRHRAATLGRPTSGSSPRKKTGSSACFFRRSAGLYAGGHPRGSSPPILLQRPLSGGHGSSPRASPAWDGGAGPPPSARLAVGFVATLMPMAGGLSICCDKEWRLYRC